MAPGALKPADANDGGVYLLGLMPTCDRHRLDAALLKRPRQRHPVYEPRDSTADLVEKRVGR